jgi:magnesium-transporting ATPase (P-type)
MRADGKVTARDTTMTFTTFVLFDMFNALACRSEKKSIFSLGRNKALSWSICGSVLGQLAAIYVPFLRSIFQTEPLSLSDLFRVALIASTVLWVDEARKSWSKSSESSVSSSSYSSFLSSFYIRAKSAMYQPPASPSQHADYKV